ncbi:MAG: AAA family ATPase [Planctomycetes bacterium]|nr:AAA family ATPase [Planctomycetota bacterium]MBI3848641.1 AAA family ATPase [Planctomycetota bacterium]
MIRKVVIRRFKRFEEETFELDGRHVVIAGPNNSGKSTVLQAIAAWGFALEQWRQLNDLGKHNGGWARKPITRQTFTAVPLRSFDALWRDRAYRGTVEVELQTTDGRTLVMQFEADSTEQVYVRPSKTTDVEALKETSFRTVYIPSITGLTLDEPVYQDPRLDQLIGMGRPGEVLRNLLMRAANNPDAWTRLFRSIRTLFGVELLPIDSSGPVIVAEYEERLGGPRFDVASGGSGFQQVLMLLAFLATRPGSVLLLDEPDAHLHVFLQEAIFAHLRATAAAAGSQMIVATHSEVIIDSVDVSELYVLVDRATRLAGKGQMKALRDALRFLDNVDVLMTRESPGVLYLEDYTDLNVLREWARVLKHPGLELLTTRLFWKKLVTESRPGAPGISAPEHHKALEMARPGFPALELVDGDARDTIVSSKITGKGFQRQRWRRYEIESYLVHPDALARFVVAKRGDPDALRKWLEDNLPPAFMRDPLEDHSLLITTKARTLILAPALTAAGLPGLPYTEYFGIAALMKPEEIHPEVTEKLDAVCKAFGAKA